MKKYPLIDLEKILSLSTVHIYWLDRNNIYQGCNDLQAKSAGLASRFDIVGKKNSDLPWNKKDPALAEQLDKINMGVMETGAPKIIEEPATFLNGTEGIFLSHKLPLKDNQGNIVGLLGISIDITNQKLQENKLKDEKEQAEFTLEYIIAHFPAHVYWKDKNGVYLGSSDSQAKSLGFSFGREIVGKTDFELPWKKEDSLIFRENDIEVMQTGLAKTTEEQALVNGKPATVLSQKIPLKNKQGGTVGIVGISIDITDRKITEEKTIQLELEKEKAAAEAKFNTLQTISASMAHELKTPLRTIASYASGLKKHLPDLLETYKKAEEAKLNVPLIMPAAFATLERSVTAIEREANGTFAIINMLMVTAGMANALIDQAPTVETSAVECITEALDHYPYDRDEEKLIHWDAAQNQALDFKFTCKKLLVVHIILNLLKNAFYYIKKASKGEIFIWLENKPKCNIIHVKDTSTGIAAKILPHIFDQFYSNTPHGTGIGLAFCKMVMQNLGGDITCVSREREFTEFVLSFPLK